MLNDRAIDHGTELAATEPALAFVAVTPAHAVWRKPLRNHNGAAVGEVRPF